MEKTKRSLIYVSTIVPVILLIVSMALWVDSRYLHKSLSDMRNLDLQIQIAEMRVKDLERSIDAGEILTSEEVRMYDIYIDQLQNLMNERNRLLGIGQ